MVYHIINAPIRSPYTIVSERHQWDRGQALSITGVDLPDVFEAHFSSVGGSQTVTMLGHNGVVEIPDELFQVAKAIVCYIYLHDSAQDGRTVYTIKIPVKERPEPSDVEPTPVQQDIITQAIAALNDAVEQTAADVSHYPKVIDGTWHIYDAETESWVDTGDAAQGPKGDKGDTGDTGPTGPQGETGPQGPKGDTGETGPKGDKGDKGDTGEKGDKGDPGEVTLADYYKVFPTDTATGAIAHFEDGADSIPMKDVLVHIEPVQEGSGDPSPDNVRPISGWTGCEVQRTGKNLIDESSVVPYGDNNQYFLPDLKHNTDYVFSTDSVITGLYAQYSDSEIRPNITVGSEWTNIIFRYNTTSLSFNSGTHKWYRLMTYEYNGSTVGRKFQLELGSTATPYEPYHGDTYPITFPTETGTVYGAYVDVTGGELVVDRAQIASYAGEALPSTWISDRDVYSAGTTPTIGAQVVYKLAEPIHYSLSPIDIKTLLGQNNLWADTGDSDVQYRADTKMYVDAKVAAAVSALS